MSEMGINGQHVVSISDDEQDATGDVEASATNADATTAACLANKTKPDECSRKRASETGLSHLLLSRENSFNDETDDGNTKRASNCVSGGQVDDFDSLYDEVNSDVVECHVNGDADGDRFTNESLTLVDVAISTNNAFDYSGDLIEDRVADEPIQCVPCNGTISERLENGDGDSERSSQEQCLIEECRYNIPDNVIKDVVRETNYSTNEKKTTKKKREKGTTQHQTSTTITTTTSSSSATTNPTNGTGLKSKKSKKSKKCDEKENISVRSGFGKFDQLTKKTLLHVRSQDSSKAQQHFSQNETNGVTDGANTCKACNKNVFAMELIKAERAVWHRNCFRCTTCNKQLTVDIYSSHEGKLYCKPHFKDLFKPKVVIEDEMPVKLKKPELIIRENQPLDLPPDVVRASDKPDLGLDELSSLNVKSRFQVFEKQNTEENDAVADRSTVCVKRSPSILSKLARFQAKGMDVGVSSDIFNGIDYEESTSSEEEEQTDSNITKSVVSREKPIAFNKMNDVKKNWENGQTARKEERREERREELQRIRSRLFMGKQNKMKEAYENAVAESEKGCVKRDVEVKAEKARLIKEKFEKGEVDNCDDTEDESQTPSKKSTVKDEDMDVFEAGISKKSRSLFQKMDAAVKTNSNGVSASPQAVQNGLSRSLSKKVVMDRQQSSENIIRSSDPVEEVTVQTADVSSKFKFFETYKPPAVKRKTFRITPPREGQLLQSNSPEREVEKPCEETVQNESEILKKSNTTAKMLSLFRQLEEAQEVVPDGPKPMKKFTPPPASSESNSEDEESTEEDSESSQVSTPGDHIIRASDKQEDEYLKMAQAAAKAKSLKEKFEKWQPEKQSNNNAINMLESEQASLDTTKSLRARFESYKSEQSVDKPRPKVNRFV